MRRLSNWWPILLGLAFLGLLVWRGVMGLCPPRPAAGAPEREIVVPADRFQGGLTYLLPGQALALALYAPDATGAPQLIAASHGRVLELPGAAQSVLLAAPAAAAPTLEIGLLNDKARLVYRPIQFTPTLAPTPSATSTPTPTATLAPGALPPTPPPGKNRVYWAPQTGRPLLGLDRLPVGAAARLVILTGVTSGPGTPAPAPFSACVRLVTPPPAAGGGAPGPLFEIRSADVAAAIQAWAQAQHSELLYDAGCAFE